jgi:hypothetical protein
MNSLEVSPEGHQPSNNKNYEAHNLYHPSSRNDKPIKI